MPEVPYPSGSQYNMDEYTFDSFVNRDDPIPVIRFDHDEDMSGGDADADHEGKDSKRRGLRANLKDKFNKAGTKTSDGGLSMQDRLLERYADMRIPSSTTVRFANMFP